MEHGLYWLEKTQQNIPFSFILKINIYIWLLPLVKTAVFVCF